MTQLTCCPLFNAASIHARLPSNLRLQSRTHTPSPRPGCASTTPLPAPSIIVSISYSMCRAGRSAPGGSLRVHRDDLKYALLPVYSRLSIPHPLPTRFSTSGGGWMSTDCNTEAPTTKLGIGDKPHFAVERTFGTRGGRGCCPITISADCTQVYLRV